MEPVSKEQIAKDTADLVYKDLSMLRQDVLANMEQLRLIDAKLSNQMINKASVVQLIGKFLQLL
jgi:hypothetical protein